MDKEITAGSLANYLNGRQYLEEITEQEEKLAQENNLVVVFGASDDLLEFRGSFYEEFSACDNGTSLYFDKNFENISTKNTIVITEDIVEIDEIEALKLNIKISLANKITQEWCPEDVKTSWKISANFKHYPFNIYDGEDLYCIGIVFSIDDLK